VVDKELCNACGLCAQYCPDGVIDEELNIDLDYCKGCGICANECPKQAIAMVREER
jgi:pyruvate ferredoxin oxidoreductase delta subunit